MQLLHDLVLLPQERRVLDTHDSPITVQPRLRSYLLGMFSSSLLNFVLLLAHIIHLLEIVSGIFRRHVHIYL